MDASERAWVQSRLKQEIFNQALGVAKGDEVEAQRDPVARCRRGTVGSDRQSAWNKLSRPACSVAALRCRTCAQATWHDDGQQRNENDQQHELFEVSPHQRDLRPASSRGPSWKHTQPDCAENIERQERE